jgi:hypothetical protein
MGFNLKNPEVERLAAEIAAMMGETKTEAIRRALEERTVGFPDQRQGSEIQTGSPSGKRSVTSDP